jgi:CubicO group peptidase (beta-lactamase class C family)
MISGCSGTVSSPIDSTSVTDDGRSYFPGTTWRTARPADVGMDRSSIENLTSRIRNGTYGDVDGLVVVRNGYVVAEEYANGSSATHLHEMQSVTKSITSLIVGIAVDKGRLSVADKALDRLPEYTDFANVDARKRDVTVHHLLTMTSGINFYEDPYPGSPLQVLNDSRGDWLRLVFDQPMNAAPGERWQYNSGGVIGLGGLLFNATGMPADQYARENLFEPIGIQSVSWYRGNPHSLPHLGGGLGLRVSDLARIGYLVLRKGMWGDRRVISEDWLRTVTAHHVRNPRTFGGTPTDYGYLWWLLALDRRSGTDWESDIITASGARGQWLFIVPKHDLVVAVTSSANGAPGYMDPVNFLYAWILPSIRN